MSTLPDSSVPVPPTTPTPLNGGSTVTNGGGSLVDSDSFEPRDTDKATWPA